MAFRCEAAGLIFCAAACLAGCGPYSSRRLDETSGRLESELRRGMFDQVAASANAGAAAWSGHPDSPAFNRFRLIQAEALLEKHDWAAVRKILDSLNPPNPPLRVRKGIDYAYLLAGLQRFEDAGAALDRTLGAPESGASPVDLVRGLKLRGSLLLHDEKYSDAEATWRDALERAQSLHDLDLEGRLLNNLGYFYLRNSRFDRALPYFDRARKVLEQAGEPRLSLVAYHNASICQYQLGDIDGALENRLRIIEDQKVLGDKTNLPSSYGEAGRIYAEGGNLREAVASYTKALELIGAQGDDNAPTWALNLAQAYIDLGQWTQAEAFTQEALKRAGEKPGDIALYAKLNAGAIAQGRGDHSAAARDYEEVIQAAGGNAALQWAASDAIARMKFGSKDFTGAQRYFEQAIRYVTASRASLDDSDHQITYLSRPIRIYRDYVQALLDGGDTAKALLVSDASRAQVLLHRRESDAPKPLTDIHVLQKAAQGRTILAFWITPAGSYVWIITSSACRWVALPVNEDRLRELVDLYVKEIITPGSPNPLSDQNSAGWKLYEAILKPIQSFIPSGSRVIVVPDGPLSNLNLESLPVPGSPNRYWIEDAFISVAPSVSILLDRKDASVGQGILVVGAAQAAGPFGSLAYAAREIDAIERRFPARTTVLKGPAATVDAYKRSQPERFSLIHFATHAEANRRKPLESAVILSPEHESYKLFARDVFEGPSLHADLVTISACSSAGTAAFSGEGLVGFAWAFLHAGARNVIAALWDADDSSAARIMDRLYNGLHDGKSPAAALHEAKLALVRSTGNLRKPYYWAAFQLYSRSADPSDSR